MILFKSSRLICAIALLLTFTAFAAALDRNAFTFTRYELDASVTPESHGFSVSGTVTVRNDSTVPQRDVDLQITSSLTWMSIGMDGKTVPFVAQPYTSDIDHTGSLSEAIVTLPQAVAPGASVTLQVAYQGTIQKNAVRLERIGTPGEVAYRTEWDEVSSYFTGVRSIGHVNWFPVAMDAASLSEGTSVFDTEAAWMQRQSASELLVTMAVPTGLKIASNADSTQITAEKTTLDFHRLGSRVPTFVMANFEVMERPAITMYYVPDHASIARDYVVACEKAVPLVTDWFGAPREKITVIDLPDQLSSTFESGSVEFLPLRKLDPIGFELSMIHPLVHSAFHSNRKWIDEGLAHFLQSVAVETDEKSHAAGLAYMGNFLPGLAQTEKIALSPNNPGKMVPQPLVTTNDDIYFRVKGAYVWIMLRELIGDEALKKAIRSYRSEADKQPAYMQSLVETPADPMAPKLDLEWFFDDWVYRDKGLAEFSIESAYPRESLMKSYMVTVTVANTGNVQADAIISLRSAAGVRSTHGLVKANSKEVLRISFPVRPDEAIVNDGTVPEYDRKNNTFTFGPETPQ